MSNVSLNRNLWHEYSHYVPTVNTDVYDHWSSIPYGDDEEDEMRILWLSRPKGKTNFATIVWFHGGGFTGDGHECPRDLYKGEHAVVEVRYRLSPKVKAPTYHEDGAAALAWVLQHISEYGGDPQNIFVGGMSAGAYLAAIVAMDKDWLAPYGFSYKDLAGLLLVSGQMTVHFQVKKDLEIPGETYQPVIDKMAPLAHLSADLPPILLITGDPRRDIPARPEENAFMAASLRALGHPCVECHSLPGHCHGGAFRSSDYLIETFIQKVLSSQTSPAES